MLGDKGTTIDFPTLGVGTLAPTRDQLTPTWTELKTGHLKPEKSLDIAFPSELYMPQMTNLVNVAPFNRQSGAGKQNVLRKV